MRDTVEQVVITGAGLLCSLGLSPQATWEAVLAGKCGMGPMGAMEQALAAGKDGGQALDLPDSFAPQLPREARYLRRAIGDALADACITTPLPYPARRCACMVGTTLHGMRAAGRFMRGGDFGELRNFLAGDTLRMAIEGYGIGGMTATTCSACSSSLGSVALGVTLLQTKQADLVIAGGYDTISEYVYGGFGSLRLVAEGPLRPFAKDRQGMKLAEGYGIVVLERADDARRRGVRALAAIAGWGESADSHHLTQPHPQGDGAARAIRQAVTRAGLSAHEIDLVAAHATGTPDNDLSEHAALASVFGQRLPEIPVVAFKSHLGHTLGGAGAVELILSAMALRDQVVPVCANVRKEEVEFANLKLSTGEVHKAAIRHTLNTSLGFGGSNACVVLGPEGESAKRVHPKSGQEVLITGIGVVLPKIVGNEALVARLNDLESPAWERDAGAVAEESLEGLLSARRVRRMSDYVKLTLAAATLACRDARIEDMAAFAQECGAVLGTMHGSSNYSNAYYSQIVKEGLGAANPMLFAEAVPNGGAAQLSLMLGLKGACQAVIGTRTAGLDALALAAARISSGEWDRAIVGAGEEYCSVVNEAYRHCGLAAAGAGGVPFGNERGFTIGAGAVLLVLESREQMQRRGGRARGRIDATAGAASAQRSGAIEAAAQVLEELGEVGHVMSSACGTWVDRAEAAAIRRGGGNAVVSTMCGHVAETFSATPLIGMAAVLLSKRMPKLLGLAAGRAAREDEAMQSFISLCTDFSGSCSGVRVSVL